MYTIGKYSFWALYKVLKTRRSRHRSIRLIGISQRNKDMKLYRHIAQQTERTRSSYRIRYIYARICQSKRCLSSSVAPNWIETNWQSIRAWVDHVLIDMLMFHMIKRPCYAFSLVIYNREMTSNTLVDKKAKTILEHIVCHIALVPDFPPKIANGLSSLWNIFIRPIRFILCYLRN